MEQRASHGPGVVDLPTLALGSLPCSCNPRVVHRLSLADMSATPAPLRVFVLLVGDCAGLLCSQPRCRAARVLLAIL